MTKIEEIFELFNSIPNLKEERQIGIKKALEKHEGKTFDNLKKVTHIYCHSDVVEQVKAIFGNDVEVVGGSYMAKDRIIFADYDMLTPPFKRNPPIMISVKEERINSFAYDYRDFKGFNKSSSIAPISKDETVASS